MTIAGTSKTIVIADDRAPVRDLFQAALEHAGHRGVPIQSAAELLALVRVNSAAIDLILLDLQLPGDPGVGLVRSIRSIDAERPPILIFSGTVARAADVRELATLAVAGYVNEHSTPEHILSALVPHLFPDNFNRRGSPRVVLSLPVQYGFGDTVATAAALDLGRGGIAIRTTTPLEAGSKLTVRFRIAGSTGDVDAQGHVAWSDNRLGMGIQFEHVDATSQSLVDEFVDTHVVVRAGM